MTFRHANERPGCRRPVAASSDLPILVDGFRQIAFDFFGVLRRFELRLNRPRRLRKNERRRYAERQHERDQSFHRSSSAEGSRRPSALNRTIVTCLSRLRRRICTRALERKADSRGRSVIRLDFFAQVRHLIVDDAIGHMRVCVPHTSSSNWVRVRKTSLRASRTLKEACTPVTARRTCPPRRKLASIMKSSSASPNR